MYMYVIQLKQLTSVSFDCVLNKYGLKNIQGLMGCQATLYNLGIIWNNI